MPDEWKIAIIYLRDYVKRLRDVDSATLTAFAARGVLSPILWTLVVDDLLTKLNEQGVAAQGYADDQHYEPVEGTSAKRGA